MPYIHRHVVCVCVCLCVCVCVCVCVSVCLSQSKRENHPVPQEGGWEIEWPYIHKDMVCVCVCVYGKREYHPVPQGRGVLLPPWPAGKPQNRRRDPVPQGGRGRIHHDVHYLLKYKST